MAPVYATKESELVAQTLSWQLKTTTYTVFNNKYKGLFS